MSQPTVGIYSITNVTNGKTYYGSSNNCERRWGEHKAALRHNKHHNIHLQRAWNKYGELCFSFQVVEELTPSDLEIVEQTYLDFTKAIPAWCYNIAKETEHTVRGIRWSETSRNKLRKYHTGLKCSDETRLRMSESAKGLNTWTSGKPANNRDNSIYVFKNTATNETFTGTRLDFQNKYNLRQGNLGSVIRGERHHTKKWVLENRIKL